MGQLIINMRTSPSTCKWSNYFSTDYSHFHMHQQSRTEHNYVCSRLFVMSITHTNIFDKKRCFQKNQCVRVFIFEEYMLCLCNYRVSVYKVCPVNGRRCSKQTYGLCIFYIYLMDSFTTGSLGFHHQDHNNVYPNKFLNTQIKHFHNYSP